MFSGPSLFHSLFLDSIVEELGDGIPGVGVDAKKAANWIMGELSARLNSEDKSISNIDLKAEQLGSLISRIKDGTISSSGAKKVFDALWTGEDDNVDKIIEAKGLKQVSDTGALEAIVDEVLAGMTDQIEQYKSADDKKRKKLMGGFMGPLMKASKGQGNPKLFNQILAKKLNS